MADPTLFDYPVAPLPHVEIAREPDWAPPRRKRKPHRRLPDEPQDRAQHAQAIANEADVGREQASKSRESFGIEPNRLLVLEFQSLDWDLLDELEDVFGALVVDERKGKDGDHEAYTYLVQFVSEAEYAAFKAELDRYREGNPERGLLTAKQRAHFFDALQTIRLPSREDRMGPRLRTEGVPASGPFFLDVDLWHPGTRPAARARVEDVKALCRQLGGSVPEDLSTNSMLLLKVLANSDIADALLTLDFVASVDRPPRLQAAYSGLFANSQPPPYIEPPDGDAPVACVIDSGVVSQHPLLAGWVGTEKEFIPLDAEGVADVDGHGTAVAGLVVYGDVAGCIESGRWLPRVMVHSAKILYHDDNLGAVFPESVRVESATENAIRYFASEFGCRVFNLSVGDELQVYAGGRQFVWAEKLDELARELDVVIVVSAGNFTPPLPPSPRTAKEFRLAVKEQMLSDDQRICSPATASIPLAVGALARGDATGPAFGERGVTLKDAFACSPARGLAPFSRTGPGYQVEKGRAAVKPELVHMGGNYGVRSWDGENPEWVTDHVNLGEPTIRPVMDGRYLTAKAGTSFAAPHVTHAAAVAERELEQAMGHPASANLVRAVLGAAAMLEGCHEDCLGDEAERLRLVGYGLCDAERSAHSTQSRVTLVSEGYIGEDSLHVFRLPLPAEFVAGTGSRGLCVSLAFDPPVRASRKEYLSRTMWFEVCKGVAVLDIQRYRAKVEAGAKEREPLPNKHHVNLRPSRRALQWSTLQVASIAWTRAPRIPILEDESVPVLHVLVGCQKRFDVAAPPAQKYGVAVALWREGEGIDLYEAVRARIRARAIETRVRIDDAR